MPSSDLNDYIQLQKEIKRLKDDNLHLSSENKELLNRVKSMEIEDSTTGAQSSNVEVQNNEILIIENLNQEIYVSGNKFLEFEKLNSTFFLLI